MDNITKWLIRGAALIVISGGVLWLSEQPAKRKAAVKNYCENTNKLIQMHKRNIRAQTVLASMTNKQSDRDELIRMIDKKDQEIEECIKEGKTEGALDDLPF